MANFNRIIIIGNLTRDPELKNVSGVSLCRLGIASNRTYKNKQNGSTGQEVCFVDVDVWGSQADSCQQYLQKGRPVLIEGRLKFDSWKDADGAMRSKHSIVADRIVFLGSSGSQDHGFDSTNPSSDIASGLSSLGSTGVSTAQDPFVDEMPF